MDAADLPRTWVLVPASVGQSSQAELPDGASVFARFFAAGLRGAGHPGEMLPAMTEAVSSATAWWVLAAAPVVITLFGMWLFSRSEYRDDI